MPLSPRKNGPTSLFKEVRVFKVLRGPTGNIPERVQNTIRTFAQNKWKPLVLGNSPIYLLSSSLVQREILFKLFLAYGCEGRI